MQIIENILPLHIGLAISNSIPDENWQWWHRYNNENSVKYGTVDQHRLPNACRIGLEQLATAFNPPEGTFPDLDYYAAGIHMLPPQGWLSGHYDSEYHPLFKWKRVGSLVWFANQEWKKDWGGKLIIAGEEVVPEFNKAIYFDTIDCWHEVTKVVGPEYRKTLALFYWQTVDVIPNECSKSAKFRM